MTDLEGVIDRLLVGLAGAGTIPEGPLPDWSRFGELSRAIHAHFSVPATTFTPAMRRLLFGLGATVAPRTIVGVGTYVAYTYSWLLAGSSSAARPFTRAIALDPDQDANRVARANLSGLTFGSRVAVVDAPGSDVLGHVTGPIDLLFLDLDDPITAKAGYADVLRLAEPALAPGALVIAHDACVPRFARDMSAFGAAAEELERVSEPIVLPVDACGVAIATVQR